MEVPNKHSSIWTIRIGWFIEAIYFVGSWITFFIIPDIRNSLSTGKWVANIGIYRSFHQTAYYWAKFLFKTNPLLDSPVRMSPLHMTTDWTRYESLLHRSSSMTKLIWQVPWSQNVFWKSHLNAIIRFWKLRNPYWTKELCQTKFMKGWNILFQL